MKTPLPNNEKLPVWKVVYVLPRSEKKVGRILEERGIENYVPIKREKRQWSDRMKWVELPLINGYVFVRPEALQRDEVLQVSGVLHYVRYNGADAVIRDIEIETLKSIASKGYFVETAFSQVDIGDEVSIHYGPFKGLNGIIVSSSGQTQYTVMIKSLDLSLRIIVPEEILKKENASHH